MMTMVYFSVPHHGLPAAVRERVREPDHLRDNERAVPRGVRGGAVLPAVPAGRPHQRCVSLIARMPPRQETGAHVRARLLYTNLKVSSLRLPCARCCV